MLGNLPECGTIFPNYDPGFFRFNQHLAGIGIKKDVRNAGSLSHH